MSNNVITKLGSRGEKILRANLVDSREKIAVKLQGSFGEGLVVTDRRLYILKWGLMAGNIIGGRCAVFESGNITSLEIKKGLMTGTFEVLTPATQNTQKSYWSIGGNDAIKSDNVITFQRDKFALFQEAVKIGRDLIGKAHAKDAQNRPHSYEALEKLADLQKRGIISEEESRTPGQALGYGWKHGP